MAFAEIDPTLRGADRLAANKDITKTVYTPPDPEHYPHGYLWDSGFHSIVYARSGHPRAAQEELEEVLSWQRPDGFIPNMKFGDGRKWDPERRLVLGMNAETSAYSQPPVLPFAAVETFNSYVKAGRLLEADNFIDKNYESLASFMRYFPDNRENQNNPLVKNSYPCETGRDSDPTFDFMRLRIPRVKTPVVRSAIDKVNTLTNYVSGLVYEKKVANADWSPEVFGVNDVMFNVIYADGLKHMATIAQETKRFEDVQFFDKKANEVSNAIAEVMWDENDGMFYAQRHGKPIKVVSISNLFPIMLPEIQPEQAERIIELIEDPDWFGTTFPLPSVPVNSRNFDPDFSEWSLWRGTTWVAPNVLIERGLATQEKKLAETHPRIAERCRVNRYIIRTQTQKMVEQKYAESYHPFTGEPKRKEVASFGMSTLADVM